MVLKIIKEPLPAMSVGLNKPIRNLILKELHNLNQKNLITGEDIYIMVTEGSDPFKDPERYMVDHLLEYERLWVLSYTPAFLLPEEVPMSQLKRDYFNKIHNRITENIKKNQSGKKPKKTIIYISEGGLEKISHLKVTKREEAISRWKNLADFANNNPEALEMHIIRDDYMPPISFILGEVSGVWRTRSPYDLLIEHRIGVTQASLFSLDSERSRWFIRLSLPKMPEDVEWLLNYIQKEAQSRDFSDWFSENTKNQTMLFSPSPEIAVVSAMKDELAFYRKLLCKDPTRACDGTVVGSGKNEIGILFPHREYGGYSLSTSVAEIINKNPTIDQIWFAGVAGGVKGEEGVQLFDVVIPNQIIQLTYEKILTEKPKSQPKNEKRLITLSNSTYIIVKTQVYEVHQELKDLANTLYEYVGTNRDKWGERIKKHSELLGPDEKKYLFDLIDNRLPEIKVDSPIWSSDHNVNDEGLASQLAAEFHVKAFDMESGGLASVCQKFNKKFFVIRGISDLADNVRDRDDVNQRIAMVTTTAALEMLLNMLAEGKP